MIVREVNLNDAKSWTFDRINDREDDTTVDVIRLDGISGEKYAVLFIMPPRGLFFYNFANDYFVFNGSIHEFYMDEGMCGSNMSVLEYKNYFSLLTKKMKDKEFAIGYLLYGYTRGLGIYKYLKDPLLVMKYRRLQTRSFAIPDRYLNNFLKYLDLQEKEFGDSAYIVGAEFARLEALESSELGQMYMKGVGAYTNPENFLYQKNTLPKLLARKETLSDSQCFLFCSFAHGPSVPIILGDETTKTFVMNHEADIKSIIENKLKFSCERLPVYWSDFNFSDLSSRKYRPYPVPDYFHKDEILARSSEVIDKYPILKINPLTLKETSIKETLENQMQRIDAWANRLAAAGHPYAEARRLE